MYSTLNSKWLDYFSTYLIYNIFILALKFQADDAVAKTSSESHGLQTLFRTKGLKYTLYAVLQSKQILLIAFASKLPQIRNNITYINKSFLIFSFFKQGTGIKKKNWTFSRKSQNDDWPDLRRLIII